MKHTHDLLLPRLHTAAQLLKARRLSFITFGIFTGLPIRLKSLSRRLSETYFVALILLANVLLAILVANARGWANKRGAAGGTSSSVVAATPTPVPRSVIPVVLRPEGFWPSKVTHPRKPIILAVKNRSGISEIYLKLYRIAGSSEKLHEARIPSSRLDWHNVFDLPPGEYELIEDSHPQWKFHITITPN
jgi:hypothetical protein